MTKRTSIVNISGDEPETLIQLGKKLGKNKLRREVFNVIYGRGQKPRSKKQIMEVGGLSAKLGQQVQNQLNYLSTNHLIVSSENAGRVNDGSAILYERDETVRAHRQEIVRIADNRQVAERMFTKRRPQVRVILPVKRITREALKKKKKLKILYLAANPSQTSPLRIDVEVARVQEEVRGSKYRDNIDIQYRPAANLRALIQGLNDLSPQILHFSGHGNSSGVASDNRKFSKPAGRMMSFDLLAQALAAVDRPPRVVVLNSCESSAAKASILKHVDALVTMRTSISDVAASVFAPQFYAAIAGGQSVKSAFAQAKVIVQDASISEKDTPELHIRDGVDAAKLKMT